MNTSYYTFGKIVEQCFDFDSERSVIVDDKDFRIRMKIKNIWDFLINNKPELSETSVTEYLAVYSFSFKGHARLREMVIAMSEYMDYHNEPKGENFNKIYKDFVEMVKPDGRSNAENYFKEHSNDNQALTIKDIENELTKVESSLKVLYKLSMELKDKDETVSGYTIKNINLRIQNMMEHAYCHALGKDPSSVVFLY